MATEAGQNNTMAALMRPWRGLPVWAWLMVSILVLVLGGAVALTSGGGQNSGCVTDANELYSGGASADSGVHQDWLDYVASCTKYVQETTGG